jgi:N-dimethylarginine dimethylaminohydrolase
MKAALRMTALAALLLLGFPLLAGVRDEVPPRISGPRILADTGGEIREVVLQYSNALASEVLPTYRDFLRQIGTDTVVHLVCETEKAARELERKTEEWKIPGPGRLKFTVVGREITVWARDRFVLKSASHPVERRVVLLPTVFGYEGDARHGDRTVPDTVARTHGMELETVQSNLCFEGGNIVSSGRFLFTGPATLVYARMIAGEEAMRLINKEFGKRVVIVGTEDDVAGEDHVDMFLTPLSDSTVLLGDPLLAACLLESAEEESADAGGEAGIDSMPLEAPPYLYRPSEEVARHYERICRQLKGLGFRVERIPIVHTNDECTITYNNVLMETRAGLRIVYMPVYGIPELDRAAKKKYETLGFRVCSVSAADISKHGGTLRCLTNVLARKFAGKTRSPCGPGSTAGSAPGLFRGAGKPALEGTGK